MADAPELSKTAADPEVPPGATDEDILRLRSRLDREFAQVAQKLADAEETLIDIEITLRSIETGSRSRLVAVSGSATEKLASRLKAVGDGITKFRDWVSKPKKEDEAPDASAPRGPRDMADRLDDALRTVTAEIRDREREAVELDRKLHEAQKQLISARAQEQHARETQIKIGQTRQLSEDLERRMAMLDDMVRSFESAGKPDTAIRPKPKESSPVIPKIDDRLQAAIEESLKNVAAQEKKVAELEKQVQSANAALVEERTRQQRIRAMQMRLRQARHFSQDLQRALSGLSASLSELNRRAGELMRPEGTTSERETRTFRKPPEQPAPSKT
ncbi:MAG TPA: hypothetical protein VEJ18_14415 [Planctomycetota bacterium]|nr:hypothetical protein [Planctomycetota bacterium]